MTRFSQSILALAAFIIASGAAQAALVDRGGGFIYDDVLDVTWLQNANVNGTDTWANQVAWADGLSVYDSVRDVTWDDWRLPTTMPSDPSCDFHEGGLYVGVNCTGSEMAHLHNVDGAQLKLFTNLQADYYWSGTEYTPLPTYAWRFLFSNGTVSGALKGNVFYALAVRAGDVAAVSDPEELINDLIQNVILFNVQAGISNALDAKLDSVLRALEDTSENNDIAALNSLYSFCSSVEAQRDKKISSEDADTLIAAVNSIIASLDEFAPLCE